MKNIPLLALVLAATLADVPRAQSITKLIPEAAAPGDVLILEGANLGAAVSVEFVATVGGFTGVLTRGATPSSVSPTRVVVQVPRINAFTPPNAVPPGDPLGSVRILDSNGRMSNTVTFYFMEATFGAITTLGTGTTQPGGLGKPAVGFTLAGGPPVLGNATFTPALGNALPGSLGLFVLGVPATPPFPMIGDGTIVLDTSRPFGTLVLPVSAQGEAQVTLPIPSTPFGATFLIQWAALAPSGIFLSNGLQFAL